MLGTVLVGFSERFAILVPGLECSVIRGEFDRCHVRDGEENEEDFTLKIEYLKCFLHGLQQA